MTVAQLIALLEAVEDKTKLVYVKNGQDDGTCCSRGDYEWDTVSYIEETMIQDYVWDGKKRKLSALNVVKIENY